MINGIKADLKSTQGDGNIVKYGKKAIYEQDADIVVFEFEKMNFEIHQEINKLRNMNIHGMYIVKGSNKKNILDFLSIEKFETIFIGGDNHEKER